MSKRIFDAKQVPSFSATDAAEQATRFPADAAQADRGDGFAAGATDGTFSKPFDFEEGHDRRFDEFVPESGFKDDLQETGVGD